MFLKRIFDHKSGKPVLTHVKVITAPEIQKFSTKFVEQQTTAGILSIGDGKITIKTEEKLPDLSYDIIRGPGLYCCHCDAPQGDSTTAAAHVAREHAGIKSPDQNNLAGYRKDNFYLTKKINAEKPKKVS